MLNIVTAVRIVLFAVSIALAFIQPSHARVWDDYGPVVLRAQVVDRAGNPVSGARVRFAARLDGVSRGALAPSQALVQSAERITTTTPDGIATTTLFPPGLQSNRSWFRGTVRFTAKMLTIRGEDDRSDGPPVVSGTLSIPATPADTFLVATVPTLRVWEAPDTLIDGFPLWMGRDKRTDRIVVVVEGFDLYNTYSATDSLRLVGGAGDALRKAGVDLMVVNFANSHLAPDQLAPTVARAIRAASVATGGRSVAVAGLSAGGITARWALVTAENENAPLPVHTLVFLDTPHRGARMNPALQAMVQRYGKESDRVAMTSAAARALLIESITDLDKQVRWKRVGPPLAQRLLPVETTPTAAPHDAFYERLHRLNDRNGYPKRVRLVAVANSSRQNDRATGNLMRVWLPYGYGWTLKAADTDLVSGSLLPRLFVDQFRVSYPLGLAGAYLPTAPTFLPASSALDAGPNETPPFDAWYARPDGLPPLAHDDVDPGVAAFVVRELLQSAWQR